MFASMHVNQYGDLTGLNDDLRNRKSDAFKQMEADCCKYVSFPTWPFLFYLFILSLLRVIILQCQCTAFQAGPHLDILQYLQ